MVTLKDAQEVTDVIVRTLRPSSVILFGSVAKECKGNDLDFMIVKDKVRKDESLILYRKLKRFYKRFSIDPFILSGEVLEKYYRKGSPFLRAIFKEGRLVYMKNIVEEWFRNAEEELSMAEYLFKGDFYKGSCYHSQQAIEKAIKAALIKKGWEREKTHSIERLPAIAKDFRLKIEMTDEEILFIDSIYREYPAEAGLLAYGEPLKEDAKRAIMLAKRILKKLKMVK